MAAPGSQAVGRRAERALFGGWRRSSPPPPARRDLQSHKRLVLLATIALLPPALARWVIVYIGLGPPVVLALSTLFVLPLVAWDLMTLGRLHPATLWGGLLVVASGPLRLAVAFTDGWLAFAEWAVGLVT